MINGQESSMWDMIPVVAQIKSGVQLMTGDKEGAKKTQMSFLNEGFGTSQARSAFFLVTSEPDKAWEIQKKFGSNLEGTVESVSVLGHVKSITHLMAGDRESSWRAMKSATSGTFTVFGGVLGGPVGAIAVQVLSDAAISVVDKMIKGNRSTGHGVINYLSHLPEQKIGDHFDMALGMASTGLIGKGIKTKPISKNSQIARHDIELKSYRQIEETNVKNN